MRNPAYIDAGHTKVDVEVNTQELGWIKVTIDISNPAEPHLQEVYNYVQANMANIIVYTEIAEKIIAEKKADITERRYLEETGGMVFNGIPILTDRESQATITGAAVRSLINPNATVNWKTPSGPVTLNATEIQALAQAVASHVQACFDREFELHAAVDNGTYTAAMLDTGWPV